MNNDFNGNDLTIDKGGVQRNTDGPLGILGQRANREAIIQQQKQGLIEVGQDLAKEQKLVENLTREFEKMKSAKDSAFSDTQIKQAVKELENYNKIADKLKYAIADIMHAYDMGNISQEELNKKTTEYKKLLVGAQAAHEDVLDVIDVEHNKINDITDALKDQRNLRKVIHNEQIKAIDKEGKEAEKTFKNSSKDLLQAWQKSVKGAREFITSVKNTLNIEELARKSEMSSAQRLQTQIQQMYGFNRSDFQQWKTSGKSGVDTAVYSSDDFKKAIEVVPELNLSAQKAADLMPTLVRGQKLLGMTAEEQTKLSVLSTRTGRDMLTFTTNRIAQYMKNDEKLNLKQLNQMIELNANLATTAAEYGIDGDFMSSLTDATKAMTDVFGQNSGKDNVYRNAAESIFSNYETAARVYGMEEGQIREYLSNGGNLYDLNKNSSGAANYVYEQLIRDYEGTLNNWQKYSEIIGDQNIANLVKSQAEAQKKYGVDLSSQTKANAATAKSADALGEMEKDYKDNMSLTQKFFSKASNWIDNSFDWVTQENFYRDVVALLTVIEATLAAGQAIGNGIDLIKSLKGGGGSGLGGKLLGSASGGTGAMGLLSKVGAGAHLLPGGSGVAAGTTGSALAGAGILAAGALGVGMMGYDAYKGYKEGGLGTAARYAFGGTATKESSNSDKLKAGLGNGLKGAAIGAAVGSVIPGVGTLVGGLVGAGIGLIGAGISQSFAKSDKVREKQLEEQRRIAKNTASSAASMEALRNGMNLTGNSYDSRVPRRATMSDSELKLKSTDSSGGGAGKSFDTSSSSKSSTTKSSSSKSSSTKTSSTTSSTTSTKPDPFPKKTFGGMTLGANMGSSPSAAGSPYPWRVSAGYNHYPDGSYHNGMDFAIAEGTKIGASKAGTVEKVQEDARNTYYNAYGMSLDQRIAAGSGVWVRGDDGNRYYYWHMSKVSVKKGDKVPEGALLGYAGNTGYSTGSHLHFGVQLPGGSYTEPANFVTSGLFNASGEAYTPSKSTSGLKNESTNKSSDINDILTSSYKVKLNSHYVGMGSGPGGTGFKDNTLSDVVSGLSEIKQTLINLSDRQTQDERIMNMISRQTRQDPRMS